MNSEVASQPGNAQTECPTDALRYAGFWRRFGAFWLDFLVFLPVIGLSVWLGEMSRMASLYATVPGLLIGLWFHVYLVKRYGGTPGKLMLKIRITRTDGSQVGYREALLRYSVLFVFSSLQSIALIIATLSMSDMEYSSLTFDVRSAKLVEIAPSWYQPIYILMNIWIWSEFIVMLTNKRRRAIHDFMAGTVVIRVAQPGSQQDAAR